MRILLIGATGTIGKAIMDALSGKHELITAGRNTGTLRVDISDPASITRMYEQAGSVDAVVSAAGAAKWGPLQSLTQDDFNFSLQNKLMGQVNLVRLGWDNVNDSGSFTLTSGVLSVHPMVGSTAVSLVNAGLEGFGRAAGLEAPRGIRVNVVSPGWVSETLKAMGKNPADGVPARKVAEAYVRAVEGSDKGKVIDASAK